MSRAITGVWPGASESPGNNPPLAPLSWVPTNRSVLAGTGLLGGGQLSSDIVFEIDPAFVVSTLLSGLAPAIGAATDGYVLTVSDGNAVWQEFAPFVGDSGSGGQQGLVPAPAAGDAAAGRFLKADGTWAVPAGGGGGGAPTDAQYVTLATNASLSNERILAGESGIISITDNGAGSSVVLGIVNASIAAAKLANGAVTLAKMASIANNTLIGNASGSSAAPSEIGVDNASLIFGPGNILQRGALTGDVTAPAGSNAMTIANGAVTLAQMANLANARLLGRVSVGAGVPESLTGTQATTLLDTFTSALKGLAPPSGGGTSNFLRADGSWEEPPSPAVTMWGWSQGAITLAVSSSGSDAPTLTRPARLLSGDYSAEPFLTVQAAIDTLPKGLSHDVLVRVAAGTFAGVIAHGFVGKGRLRIAGSKALSTLTSGVNTGTAGAGTSFTSLNKPAAAANWTASDLRGKFLVITSGGGESGDADFPTIRAIKSNTTTALVVDTIFGMDATSVFQIIDVATILTGAGSVQGVSMRYGAVWCQASIEATLLKMNENGGWYGALLWNCHSAKLSGCDLAASSGLAVGAISCTEAWVDYCLLNGLYNPFVVQWMQSDGLVIQSGGGISAQHVMRGIVVADAIGCTGTAIKIQDSVAINLSANLNNCAVTPLDLQNIHNFRVDGYLTGTNATPSRGMVISRGGQYIITGATLAGSSSDQFELEGRAGSYAELSGVNSGTYSNRGSFLHWGSTGYVVQQSKFRVQGGESGDDYDEFITNGMVVGGLVKHYGAWQFLDPAYKEVTAFAGGGQASATVAAYSHTRIGTCVTSGDSVRLLSSAEVAYVGGIIGSIHNAGAAAANIFPPSGKKIYLNGITDLGTDAATALPVGSYAIWLSRNDTHYNVWILGTASGPSSSTANAIAKYSGTGGQTLIDTGVTIDSANGISGHTEVQNVQTGTTYTMQASDTGKVVIFTNAAAVTVTVPASLGAGWHCRWEQRGAGKVSFNGVAVAAATLRNRQTHNASAGQYAVGGLACYTTGDVTLFGDTGT